jgi:hypothetical protein
MKKFLGLAIGLFLVLFLVVGFTSSAEPTIRIKVAEVQNGVAFIRGSAEKKSPISWETQLVTTTNAGGQFSFNGVVPLDCVGTLSDGVSTIDVAIANCTPVSQGGGVLKTGQTTCYDSLGSVITCTGTGQDGEFQAGTPVPSPRFTDNGDGTITDNLTGLTWLKDAGCLGRQDWASALAAANALADGNLACALTDGSVAGDWRLPNRNEIASLLNLGTNPASTGLPFMNFVDSFYWSSTTRASETPDAWIVDFGGGTVTDSGKQNMHFVTAVRRGS